MAITSGRSQAESIAKFAHNVTYEDLTPERWERLKISILDSLACAISAIGATPIKAYFTQAKELRGSDARSTLIGADRTAARCSAQPNRGSQKVESAAF